MAVLELLTVIASPIVGIVGGFLQRKHERKIYDSGTERLKVTNSHEIALTELSMKASAQEKEQDIALADLQGSLDVFKAGIEAEANLSNIEWGKSTLGDIANFTRAMIRPVLTLFLVGCLALYTGHELYNDGISQENRILLIAMVDSALMTLAFWFASRSGSYKTRYEDGTYSRG